MVVLNNSNIKATLHDNILVARVQSPNITHLEHTAIQSDLMDLGKKYGFRMILDLGEVLIIGSSGLSVFISLNKEAAASKGFLALANMKPDLVEVLRMTHLLKLFKLYKTTEDALSALK